MTTDTERLAQRLEAMEAQLTATQAALDELLAHTRGQQDFIDEMRPVASSMMRVATRQFAQLESEGSIGFGRSVLRLGRRVMEGYTPEDVDALGDSVVAILDTVRAVTQPEILALVQEGAETLEEAEEAAPIGVIGLARASGDVNVQKGLGILVATLRHVGRASRVLTKKEGKLRRGDRARTASRTPVSSPSCATPAPRAVAPAQAAPAPVFPELGGLSFDSGGFLTDASQWTEAFAEAAAADLNIALGERHWIALRTARALYDKTGESPNIRRLTTACEVTTKELYRLFPRAPGKTVARIAGLPRPVGCL